MRNGRRWHPVWCVTLLLTAAVGLFARVVPSAQGTADARFVELAKTSLSQIDGKLVIPGLRDTVDVIRDRWGVPHIYAKNTDDLFFAQGYVQAQDRLWQMELWRRYNGGRLAEIVGPQAVEHDRLLRLIQYQGPWDDTEFTIYHPAGAPDFHRVCQRRERVHRGAPQQPARGVQAHGHHPSALDVERCRAAGACAVARQRTLGDQVCADRRAPGTGGSDATEPAGSVHRGPAGARPRHVHFLGGCAGRLGRHTPRGAVPATTVAGALPRCFRCGGFARLRNAGRLPGEQQLGREREANGQRRGHPRQRPASAGHESITPLHRPPERPRMGCRRRHRARHPRCGHRTQRARGMGPHDRRNGLRRCVRGGVEP